MDANLNYLIWTGLTQLAGFFGLFLAVLSFQRKSRSQTLMMQLGASLSFAVHFSMLGAWTGAAMNVLAGARASYFRLRESYPVFHKKFFLPLFIALYWSAGLYTWTAWFSILPIYSLTMETFALWSKSGSVMRKLFLAARPGWITYNLIVGSVPGVFTEALVTGSILVSVWRFDIKGDKSKTESY